MADEVVGESKRRVRKRSLKAKLDAYLAEYKNILICNVDNVGSNQMQKIRIALRGSGVILMGKNTICRMAIRQQIDAGNSALEALLPVVRGNVGFVFTNGDLNAIRKLVLANKVPAAAKGGSVAPIDVFVPPGPTGLDPGQTSFFQALNIGTKISRGSIEIVNQVHLIKAGEKVTSSHVALLTKLDIKPFFYGLKANSVYENGAVYDADILDLTPADLFAKFFGGVRKIAALSLAIGYPTVASVPHILGNAWSKLLAVSLATGYEFKEAKEFLAKAASGGGGGGGAAPAKGAAPAGAAPAKGAPAKAAPKVKEPEPEVVDDEPMMNMFGDE
jgi:large subunit ribosomal protein LP0